MYVITHHHQYDEVLLGPIEWRPSFIASVLQSDLDLNFKPNVLMSDEQRVPFSLDFNSNVRIRKYAEVREEINPKIQRHEGPFWSYTDDVATGTYTAANKGLNLIKGEQKNLVTSERYNKEVSGTKVTIQGQEVFVDTSRNGRTVYNEKYQLLADSETINWKFNQIWLTLTKEELKQIVDVVNAHVQSSFDWEMSKHNEIETLSTHEELDAFTFVEPTGA
jgi:hypothetical protein